jgi:alkylation response protein AidB-like acyl-CoA dehydrogenase
MEQAELEIFRQGLRDATAAAHTAGDLDAALVDLGWHDALAAEPRTAISVLFDCQGSANATSSALDDVLLATLGPAHQRRAVLLPLSDRWDPPGEFLGARLSVRGLGTARLCQTDSAVVIARTPQGECLVVTKITDLTLRPVQGIDPGMGLTEVTGTMDVRGGREPLGTDSWTTATGMAQLAIGYELVGAAETMLELARAYALERIQFGRPISQFQAVRHRLAETLVAIEAARAALTAAWDDGAAQTPALVKALAGRNARTAARHCQQVLAGMGFTTEHPLHRYIRRVLVLDELFGSSRSLTSALGRDVIARRQVPAPVPL